MTIIDLGHRYVINEDSELFPIGGAEALPAPLLKVLLYG